MSRKGKNGDSGKRVLLEGTVPAAWIFGVLAAVALIVVVAVIGFSAVNNIRTCELCHLVQPEVDSYKRSAHYQAGVGCQQCHTKPGVFNYAIRNLQGVTNLILYVSDTYERPLTTAVGTNNCVQCHPKSQIERDQVIDGIRVNHTGLREAGYQCITCHASISHPGTQLEIARASQNKMPICARCHDGKQLPDDCNTCHVGGRPPADINVAMTAPMTVADCAGCHKGEVVCEECHNGLAMPHPARWIKQHGPIVNERGKEICVECHLKNDPRFCIDCHGVVIPHPDDWTARHDTVGQKDPQVCVKCHGKDPCITCHGLQMPHPSSWMGQHSSVALSNPSLCGKCHSSQFCTSCHGVALPHSAAFVADHPNHVYNQGSVCMKCHGNGGTGPQGCWGGQCHEPGSSVN